MKPSIGRIVHFVGASPTTAADHYAAIVTHVWSDFCINLFVFANGGQEDGLHAGVKTSVVYAEVPAVGHSWHWPERD